jgi:inhibitor of growth protein 4
MASPRAPAASPGPPPAFSLVANNPQSKPAREVQRALKSLTSVQLTVERSLASTRELDERFSAAQEQADMGSASYLEDAATEHDIERLRKVRADQRAALLIAEKKVAIVTEAHDAIERQIERLDAALNQFQGEFGLPASAVSGAGAGTAQAAVGAGGFSFFPGQSEGSSPGGRGRRGSGAGWGASAASAGFLGGAGLLGGAGAAAGGLSAAEAEETFCTCGRISFGQMVGCDNPSCAIE